MPSWVFRYHEKTKYSKESITAFYFPEGFRSETIPEKYARMIGYADCLIDTSTSKFHEDASFGRVMLPKDWRDMSRQKQEKLLAEMRSTKVVGSCSMDNSPRIHAVNIAMLSAETTNWEVFLRAHLDIMNDRFDRASDGSYAWAARKTYIREIEELDINAVDLILGISLRVQNPSSNHYYGSIGRIGRALAETQNPEAVEQALLSMMGDQALDQFNRLIAFFLFDNYVHYLTDENRKEEKKAQLKAAVQSLPQHLAQKIEFE